MTSRTGKKTGGLGILPPPPKSAEKSPSGTNDYGDFVQAPASANPPAAAPSAAAQQNANWVQF